MENYLLDGPCYSARGSGAGLNRYKNSLKKRKELLAIICKQNKTWKIRMALYVVLNVLSVAAIGAMIIILVRNPADERGIFMFMSLAVVWAFVPFIIACSVKNTAKYKCAFPYSSFANGNLNLYDDRLEFVHWRVGKAEPAAYSSKRAVYKEEDAF